MDEYESLSHTKWECKYHIVFIPKGRRRALYGQLRQHLGEVFRRLAEQKESRVEEGHLMVDDAVDSAEVCGVERGGVHQGEECDPFGTGVRGAQAQFRGSEFLGPRILCVNGGSG